MNMKITLLFCKASPKYCAPLSPILLPPICNSISTFFCKREQIYERDKKRRIITVLFRITWARCCAPEAVILLENRFNIVSVYVCRQIWEYKIKRKHWWSHRIIP